MSPKGVVAEIVGDSFVVSGLQSWHDYRLVLDNIHEFYQVALVYDVFSAPVTVKQKKRNPDKCPECKFFRQYYCFYVGEDKPIPPGTFIKGCDFYQFGGKVYF